MGPGVGKVVASLGRPARALKGAGSARLAAPGQSREASCRREASVRVRKKCQDLDTDRGNSELAGD